ncbi:hypothetical protein ACFSUD_17285 [Sulfitobacter aestuarii]|uniref:VPEID-CTERM sorting domain-containing protein n=1 Tax=Sulfitobacter aestuarii TaxID=2161676 RepID=A0ABW5U630_9RHOB
MKKLIVASAALLASAQASLAEVCTYGESCGEYPPPTNVPEISAQGSIAALAVVGVITLLAWERRRRQA